MLRNCGRMVPNLKKTKKKTLLVGISWNSGIFNKPLRSFIYFALNDHEFNILLIVTLFNVLLPWTLISVDNMTLSRTVSWCCVPVTKCCVISYVWSYNFYNMMFLCWTSYNNGKKLNYALLILTLYWCIWVPCVFYFIYIYQVYICWVKEGIKQ